MFYSLVHLTVGCWQLLHGVLVLGNGHDGHTGNLADAHLQALITGGDEVAPVLVHPINQAVISVSSLVIAFESLEARVAGNAQGHTVLWPELLQLCQDAVRDDGRRLRIQAVHHALDQVNLVLNGKIDEIRVYEHLVGWHQGSVVTKVHGTGNFLDFTGLCSFFGSLGFGLLLLVALQPRISRVDNLFHSRKLFNRLLLSLTQRN